MKKEIEVKILDIDVEEIKKKLKNLGATIIKERNMKRCVYDLKTKDKNSWIRLRDDSENVTLTIKEIDNDNIDGTKELEISVEDFDKTREILEKLGYNHKRYEENKRISYKLDDVEIEIDFWPGIPPYLEIEGKTTDDVKKAVELLGYKMKDTTSINTIKVYHLYGLDLNTKTDWKF